MSINSISKVVATSTLAPKAELKWKTDLYDYTGNLSDEEVLPYILLYNNLMYDLVGAVLGKLGWEYSKLISGEVDRSKFDATMAEVSVSLNNES